MNKNLKLILAAAVATTFAASAHNTPNALVDSQGKAVKGDFGQCIESVYNSVSSDCIHSVDLTLRALFDTDKSVIRTGDRAEIGRVVEGAIKEFEKIDRVVVIGNTDSVGNASYNQGLSERRALAVAQFLVSKGINPEVIQAVGKGETNPMATNSTREGRQLNRRVDVGIQGVAVEK